MSDILDPVMLRARSLVRTILLFPAEIGPTLADAVEIADESAVCLIESDSHPIDDHGFRWWDTTYADGDSDDGMQQALRYLEARGLLIRHPERQHTVRFQERGG